MLSVVPLRLGDCPSFYKPRRGHFTGVPHYFIYVRRHVILCRGVDGHPGESCFWRDVMACPVSIQERLQGWRCRGRLFGGHPRADSRVPLTGGRTRHSSGRGGVPSPHAPTALGMATQCPGWSHRADGDGGDAPDVTARPHASAEQASVPIRGFRRPLSRVRRASRTRVGGTVSWS
jgi:hypothetical protein